MKYCIRQDRPLTGLAGGDQFLGGCEIYGVHHDCVGCPNLVEMGYRSYSATTVADNTMVQEEKPIEGLEEEIYNYANTIAEGTPLFEIIPQTARHFAKWGAEHLKK